MKLNIKNVGPFSGNQEIELEEITILAGLNGVGKSTFGKVIYSVFSSFYDIEKKIIKERKEATLRYLFNRLTDRRFNYQKQALIKAFIKDVYESEPKKNINQRISELIDKIFDKEDENEKKEIEESIYDIYILDKKIIKERILGNQIENEFGNQLKCLFSTDNNAEIELINGEEQIEFLYSSQGADVLKDSVLTEKALYFDDPNILNALEFNSDYSLANYNSHQTNLLKMLYNGPKTLTSSVDQILLQKRINSIEEMINNICDGEIRLADTSQYRYYSKDFKEGLNIGNMATGLKTFAIIKMLLRSGVIEENDILILDEPEIHLHPEWQKVWAEIIVLLNIHLGIRVLISTHSSDFLSFMELYVHKYNIISKTRLYKLDKENGKKSVVTNVIDDWDKIYGQLGKPFLRATEELDRLIERK